MAAIYLHNHKQFPDLLSILEEETGIQASLIEKDYWIMQALHGLQANGFSFELKGGTSLSKGFGVIQRFSEDIDIHINPPKEMEVNENPNNTKKRTIERRKAFYDWVAAEISIDGMESVERDTAFDDKEYYRSGGIRLHYNSFTSPVSGLKEGILLEAGFDDIAPNHQITISSWAYDRAISSGIDLIDNRAIDVVCYDPGYTLVEKLQTIATKFRRELANGESNVNFMRQYYDVYCLLSEEKVIRFIGTEAYHSHKLRRFPKLDFEIPIVENEAFLLNDENLRNSFIQRYQGTAALYYKGQPPFVEILKRIQDFAPRL